MGVPTHVGVIAETIALMEAQLGHIPEHTVAVQGLKSRPGGPAAGFGIGPLVTASATGATGPDRGRLAQRIGAEMTGCDVVIIACYTIDDADAIAISASIRAECEALGAQVTVDEAGFRELPGPAPCWPRSVIEQTTWATRRVQMGRAVVPAAQLTPIPALSDVEKDAITAEQARLTHDAAGEDVSALTGAVQAFETVLAGQRPAHDPAMVAQIAGGLHDSDSRDVMLVAALPGGRDLARQAAGGNWDTNAVQTLFSSVITGLARPPEPAWLDRTVAVMARVGAASEGRQASNAYSINAFVCFAAGDRARVHGWLDHAEKADPSATFPTLLRTSLQIGLGPAPAWHQGSLPGTEPPATRSPGRHL